MTSLRVDNQFTMHYSRVGNNFEVTFSDCDYKRGVYAKAYNHGILYFTFISSATPQFTGSSIYIPGTSTRHDNLKLLISAGFFQLVLDALNKKPEPTIEEYLTAIYPKETKHYFIPYSDKAGWKFHVHTCKESTLYILISPEYKRTTSNIVYTTESFSEAAIAWLQEIQKSISDPIIITKVSDSITKIEIPAWWYTQGYYRIGWFLLAMRVINNRSSLSGSQTTQFHKFRDGAFSLQDSAYLMWTGSSNWIKAFEHPAMFVY